MYVYLSISLSCINISQFDLSTIQQFSNVAFIFLFLFPLPSPFFSPLDIIDGKKRV